MLMLTNFCLILLLIFILVSIMPKKWKVMFSISSAIIIKFMYVILLIMAITYLFKLFIR